MGEIIDFGIEVQIEIKSRNLAYLEFAHTICHHHEELYLLLTQLKLLSLYKLNCNRFNQHESPRWPRLCFRHVNESAIFCLLPNEPSQLLYIPRAPENTSYGKIVSVFSHNWTQHKSHWRNSGLSRCYNKVINLCLIGGIRACRGVTIKLYIYKRQHGTLPSPNLAQSSDVQIARENDIYEFNCLRNRYCRYTSLRLSMRIFYSDRQYYWKCDKTMDIYANVHGKRTVSTNKSFTQLAWQLTSEMWITSEVVDYDGICRFNAVDGFLRSPTSLLLSCGVSGRLYR